MCTSTYTTLISSLILLYLFSPAVSLPSFRSLESIDPHTSTPNIDIPIKAEESDYRFFTLSDPTLFYCEKTMDPLGVNDICSLQTAHFGFTKPLLVANLSSLVYPLGNHMLFFGQNLLYIYSLQTNFERPRVQMMSALTLAPQANTTKIDYAYFDAPSQLIITIQGSKALFYRLSGSALELKFEADDPLIATVDFKDKVLSCFGNKYIVYFDRNASEMTLFTINEDKTLSPQSNVSDCQEIFVEAQYVLAFTGNKVRAIDGKQELGADFPYKVRAVIRSPPSGLLVFAQDSQKDSEEEATLFSIEFFEKKGFRLTPLLTAPRDARAVHLTPNNLYIVYDKWVRVYPVVKEKEFGHEYYFDSTMTSHIFGVAVASERDFLVVKGKDQDVELHEASRSGFALECKKEKSTSVVEYSFQVRCFSTKCDNPDFSTQKFSNGSCAYTRTMRIFPEEQGGGLGIALLVGLGFIAGIAITIGLGVLHCFATKPENNNNESRRPRSPKDKRAFNINKGLRRNNTGTNIENKKFLGEVDDSYTSEELRDVMLHSTKKKSQTMFETPRFVGAGPHGNHMYVNIDSKDQTNEMGDLMIGSGVQDEEGSGEVDIDTEKESTEKEKKGKVEIGKLKLDGKVFGKDLVSFRDVAMQNVIHEEKEHKEGKSEENAGKYQKFQDEEEEEEDENDKGEENGEEQGEGQEGEENSS